MNKATDATAAPPAPPVDGLAGLRKSPEQMRAKREQQLVDSLAEALRDSSPHYMCWLCWERKTLWDDENRDAIEFARTRAVEAGADSFIEFLPEPLLPSDDDPLGKTGRMPATFEVWTWVSGTGLCALHGSDAIIEQARQQEAQRAAHEQAVANQLAQQRPAAEQQQAGQPQQQAPDQPRPQIIVAPAGPSIDTLAQAAATATGVPGQTAQLPPRRGVHRAR